MVVPTNETHRKTRKLERCMRKIRTSTKCYGGF